MQSIYPYSKKHLYYLISQHFLSSKHNTTPIQYSIQKINTLLHHNKVHYTSLFKEHLIYTDIEDYIYLYYPLYKSLMIIKHIHLLYQHQIPAKHFPSENIRKIMLKHFHYSQRQHKTHPEHNDNDNKNKAMKYSYIFPLNIQKDNNETNTNFISSTSENTIYSNTNNDISYTLDLNINIKYDYKAINKNTDFINSSISVLNNIITDINGKKVSAKTIHKRNKNNFLSHLSTIKTKLQKQTPKYNKQLHLNLNETNFKPQKTKSNQCYTIRNRPNTNNINNTNNNITNSNTIRVNTTNNITNGTICQSQSNLQVNLTCTSTPIKKRVSSLINGNNYNTLMNSKPNPKPIMNNNNNNKETNYRQKILKNIKGKNSVRVNRNLCLANNELEIKRENTQVCGLRKIGFATKYGLSIGKMVGNSKDKGSNRNEFSPGVLRKRKNKVVSPLAIK